MGWVTKSVSLLLCTSLLSGCGVARRELRHSGGYPGYVMNQHLFEAKSKQAQLFRIAVIFALASRVGVATVRDGKEADAFVAYMGAVSDELNYLAAHIYDSEGKGCSLSGGIDVNNSDACHTQLFESDLPQVEYKLVKLAVAALPQKQAAELFNKVKNGNALAAVAKLLKVASVSLDGLHRGAAVYRSEQEILAAAMKAGDGQCHQFDRVREGVLEDTVENAVRCRGLSLEEFSISGKINDVKYPENVSRLYIDNIYRIVRNSCGLLPIGESLSNKVVDVGSVHRNAVEDRGRNCRSLQFKPTVRFNWGKSSIGE